jgi:hypothetical protein
LKKAFYNETSRKRILTRNGTEANIIESHREKKADIKDRLTPFKKKPLNAEEPKNLGNHTSRIGIAKKIINIIFRRKNSA